MCSKLDMQKYPDGLYIKDDKITAVMAHPIINASGTLLGMKKNFVQNKLINIFYWLLGVVEFYRNDNTIPFGDEDEEVCYNDF